MKLKPCDCGSENIEMRELKVGRFTIYWRECTKCYLEGQEALTKTWATRKWNKQQGVKG